MMQYALPILFTLLTWWVTTGIVLLAINLRHATYPWSLAAATVVLAASLICLAWISEQETVGGAYVAFCCGVLIWGWIEISYYTGLVTGPRPHACPSGVGPWRRFSLALQASLYHELAIVGLAGLSIALTWGAPNQVGTWTFVILWLMRWSAKLNIFFGVPNLNLHWFPDHLRYLESFIVKRPMNPLFPVSIIASVAVALCVLSDLTRSDATPVDIAAALLLGTLILLAILEHGFLVLPFRDSVLWNWAIPSECPAKALTQAPSEPPCAGRSRRFSKPLPGLDTVAVYGSSPPRSAPSTNGR